MTSFLTFTGVDEQTDLDRLVDISSRYPVEWGILVGGRPGKARYPSWEFIQRLCALPVSRSLHLCGERSYEIFLKGGWDAERYRDFRRVQVNARAYDYDLMQRFSQSIRKPVIVQIRSEFPAPREGLHFLYDCSGGRGQLSKRWPSCPKDPGASLYGCAGGLRPENIKQVLSQISACHWLDMETGVRDLENGQDRFDLNKVETVCQAVFE